MAGLNSVRFVVFCFLCAPPLCRGIARRKAKFAQDPELVNKKMEGDAVVTYYNVSAVTCAARCTSKYSCGAFAYKRGERVCKLCGLCGNFSLVDAPGYQLYVLKEGPLETPPNQNVLCPDSVATPNKCWKLIRGGLVHVSVGPIGVWGVNRHDDIYYRSATYQNPLSFGSGWSSVAGGLDQVDVSTTTLWGVNSGNIYYHRKDVSSSAPTGSAWNGYFDNIRLKWISASPGGSLWGRDTSDQAVHYQHSAWQSMGMDIQRVDAGLAGVWVLNTSGQLLHRLGTYGDSGSAGTGWRALEGTFQSVATGRDLMVAVDTAGQVWLRTGLGPHTPTGLAWLRYPGSLKQVDVYQTEEGVAFWGVDAAGQIFFSKLDD